MQMRFLYFLEGVLFFLLYSRIAFSRGVADAGAAGVTTPPPLLKTAGVDLPPDIWIFQYFFLKTYNFLHFLTFSK